MLSEQSWDSDSKEQATWLQWICEEERGELESICEGLPLCGGGEMCTYPQTLGSLLLSRSVVLRI